MTTLPTLVDIVDQLPSRAAKEAFDSIQFLQEASIDLLECRVADCFADQHTLVGVRVAVDAAEISVRLLKDVLKGNIK